MSFKEFLLESGSAGSHRVGDTHPGRERGLADWRRRVREQTTIDSHKANERLEKFDTAMEDLKEVVSAPAADAPPPGAYCAL